MWLRERVGMSMCARACPLPPARIEAMMLDRADAAWVGPVCAVLWGCKTVPCVSLCVRVFFDDDKLLSALVACLPESSLPLPTYRLWVTVCRLGSSRPL